MQPMPEHSLLLARCLTCVAEDVTPSSQLAGLPLTMGRHHLAILKFECLLPHARTAHLASFEVATPVHRALKFDAGGI